MSTEVLSDRLAGTWAFNPVHSSASFSVKYLVATFSGRFDDVNATLSHERLSGSVRVDSIEVKDEHLAQHLQAPDFFDGERHPEIAFGSNVIAIDGDGVVLDGELTIKGITKPLRATGTVNGPVEDFLGNTVLGFVLETTIDRSAFGVDWNADMPRGGKALSNEVTLVVELEFKRS